MPVESALEEPGFEADYQSVCDAVQAITARRQSVALLGARIKDRMRQIQNL